MLTPAPLLTATTVATAFGEAALLRATFASLDDCAAVVLQARDSTAPAGAGWHLVAGGGHARSAPVLASEPPHATAATLRLAFVTARGAAAILVFAKNTAGAATPLIRCGRWN